MKEFYFDLFFNESGLRVIIMMLASRDRVVVHTKLLESEEFYYNGPLIRPDPGPCNINKRIAPTVAKLCLNYLMKSNFIQF